MCVCVCVCVSACVLYYLFGIDIICLTLLLIFMWLLVVRDHRDDEYAWAGVEDPKLMITTSHDPSSRLKQFVKVCTDFYW